MTDKQALRQARQIWGNRGHISKARFFDRPDIEYRVGKITTICMPMFLVEGCGKTWEDAFSKVQNRGMSA